MIYEPLTFTGNQEFFNKIAAEQEAFRQSNQFVELPVAPEYIPLEEKFRDIATMQPVVLGGLIKEHWMTIVDDIFDNTDNVINRIHIFTNPKFAEALAIYFSSVPVTSIETFRFERLNNLIYKFVNELEDEKVKKSLLKVAYQINRGYIASLNNYINIDESTANLLVVARYSSAGLMESARAVNNVIATTSLSTENIIDVYHVLYQRISEILTGVMYDARSEFKSDHEQEMYEKCTTAILDYLNMQEYGVILGALSCYLQNGYYFYPSLRKRMSLRTIPADKYERILMCIKELEMTNGIYVD